MKYVHRFQVTAPLERVVEFHKHSASMGAITPPPIVVRVHRAPVRLAEGDEMEFTLWVGPFPIRWLARIEQVTPTSFVDRQVRGPFTRWVHRHSFVALSDGTTEVLDEVEVELATQWFWRLVGFGMWLNLPVLFAFRAWKTRRLLGDPQADPAEVA
jgi:ligand-binding SRPBCC domain-containing protein